MRTSWKKRTRMSTIRKTQSTRNQTTKNQLLQHPPDGSRPRLRVDVGPTGESESRYHLKPAHRLQDSPATNVPGGASNASGTDPSPSGSRPASYVSSSKNAAGRSVLLLSDVGLADQVSDTQRRWHRGQQTAQTATPPQNRVIAVRTLALTGLTLPFDHHQRDRHTRGADEDATKPGGTGGRQA